MDLFLEVLLCRYWSAAYVSCVPCYLPDNLCHCDYIGPPTVVTVASLFNDSVCPWSTTFTLHGYCRPYGKEMSLCKYHCPLHVYLDVLSYWVSSLSMFMGSLFIESSRTLNGLLNNDVAGLDNPAHVGNDLICNKARFTLLLVLRHFYCPFENFIQASTRLLLWWWYSDVMVCSMFICLQNCLHISGMKFMPTSEIILLRSPNSTHSILAASTRSQAVRLLALFTIGNLL